MAEMVSIGDISIRGNVRRIPGVDDPLRDCVDDFPDCEREKIVELADSIKRYGLLQPVLLRRMHDGGKFLLISGFRRFKAVQYLGHDSIDAVFYGSDTVDDSILQMVENIQRDNLNPVDIAICLDKIKRERGITRQSMLAMVVNKSPAWVSQHLALLRMSKRVVDAVASGETTLSAALHFSKLDKSEQTGAFDDAMSAAKNVGKRQVSKRGAKRQVGNVENRKSSAQVVIRPVAEREAEQRVSVIDDFCQLQYGDGDVPGDAKELLGLFWDYLMRKNRLYIFSK